MIEALLLLLASDGAAQLAANVTEPDPKAMSQKEIRAFNAQLPRDHPYYIRCVRSAEVGSLVKRSYSCRTNDQWREAQDKGNQEVRDIADKMASKAANSN